MVGMTKPNDMCQILVGIGFESQNDRTIIKLNDKNIELENDKTR